MHRKPCYGYSNARWGLADRSRAIPSVDRHRGFLSLHCFPRCYFRYKKCSVDEVVEDRVVLERLIATAGLQRMLASGPGQGLIVGEGIVYLRGRSLRGEAQV